MDSYSSPLLHVGEAEAFVREAASAAGQEMAVRSIGTVEEATAVIEREPIVGVVAEQDLPDGSGLELLSSVAGESSAPFVLLTREESLRTEAIEAGASDAFYWDGAADAEAVLGRRLANVLAQRDTLSEYANTMSDTVLLLDAEGQIVTATLGDGGVFDEYTADQLVGETFSGFVADEDATRTERQFQRLVAGETDREMLKVSFMRQDNTFVPGEIRLTAPPSGGPDGFVVATLQDALRHDQEDRRSTSLADLLLDTIDDVFYLLDAEGDLIRWNDHFSAVTGYSDEEIAEMSPLEFFAEEDRECIATAISEVFETGSASVEAEMLTKDGERIHFDYTGAALTDADGTTRGVVGIGRDISERKQRERDLRRYETIIDVLADPVYTLDTEGRYTYVNEAFVEHTGYDRERILGTHVSEVLPDEEIERGRDIIRKLLSDPQRQSETWEMSRVTADGERVPTENHTALLPRGEDGQFRGSVGIVRDISERKQRERELRRERDRLESVFDAAPYPFAHVSFEGQQPTVLQVNDAFEEVFGFDESTLVGNSIDAYITPETEQETAGEVNERTREGAPTRKEVTRQTADGTEREFLFESAPLTRADGTVEGLGAYVDITERKEREQELKLKNRAMDEAPIGITIHDATQEGCPISYANDGFEQLTGYTPADVEGAQISTFAGAETDEADLASLTNAFGSAEPAAAVVLLYRTDGTPFWGRVSLAPVTDEEGATTHFVGFLQDVTTIKEHEQEVARRLEEFGDLLAEDLRVPVQQARDAISSASANGDSPDIEDAKHSLERVEDLIEDLTTVHARSVTSREVGDVLRSENDQGADE